VLFLVISNPRPERPSTVAKARQSFWPWMETYRNSGVCRYIFPKVGRGAVAVLEVADNAELHRILNEWSEIIPAEFEIHALVDPSVSDALLKAQTEAGTA
jgi:hypothetical protein